VIIAISLVSVNVIHIRGPRSLAEWLLITKPLHVEDNRNMVATGMLVKSITANGATVAVVLAGAMPYFMDRNAIDLLGKNDRAIAHGQMHTPPDNASSVEKIKFFYPGHLKYDYKYSIDQLEPDVVIQLWRDAQQAVPYLDAKYQKVRLGDKWLYLRRGSPRILWERVTELSHGA
jgi:hypothetical protein